MILVKLKSGVRITGIRPELVLGIQIMASVFESMGLTTLTITSCMEGEHRQESLHYLGCAVDLRIHEMVEKKTNILLVRDRLRDCLGPDFDVLVEKDHIHVEFQPQTSY